MSDRTALMSDDPIKFLHAHSDFGKEDKMAEEDVVRISEPPEKVWIFPEFCR